MRKIEITAEQLVSSLANLPEGRNACILDSCGVGKTGMNLLIAGIDPVEICETTNDDPSETLRILDEKLGSRNLAVIFTSSYDFGLKLQRIERQPPISNSPAEPDIFLALFDCLIVHDYESGVTFLSGNDGKFDGIADLLFDSKQSGELPMLSEAVEVKSNFTRSEYFDAIHRIKELIRSGETYQTNLTQQLSVELSPDISAAGIFLRLRKNHPAPFAAYIDRGVSKVVSASPEQFIRVTVGQKDDGRNIAASPIKGTRRRGATVEEDELLKAELIASEKDRAENTMIVDLMRNDLGRICEYGSIRVDSLCRLEEHPTLFHLVSTVTGKLREDVRFSDIIKSVFPCGSITGAPKIRTMRIIEDIENVNRGLSMGAIGYRVPEGSFGLPSRLEMSVAIRTMVIHDGRAVFSVGGGIVIDSDAETEYDESMLKAKALLDALKYG